MVEPRFHCYKRATLSCFTGPFVIGPSHSYTSPFRRVARSPSSEIIPATCRCGPHEESPIPQTHTHTHTCLGTNKGCGTRRSTADLTRSGPEAWRLGGLEGLKVWGFGNGLEGLGGWKVRLETRGMSVDLFDARGMSVDHVHTCMSADRLK